MTKANANLRVSRIAGALLGAGLAIGTAPAGALEFEIADHPVKLENLFTVGAMMRMQDRDSSLIGKSTLARMHGEAPLCVGRNGDDGSSGPGPEGSNSFYGDTCTTANGTNINTPSASNLRFVQAPGSYAPNGDNGNLNFDKGEIVHATAKLTTDLTTELFGWNTFVRGLYFFDANYVDLTETRPDTTLQRGEYDFSGAAQDTIGSRSQLLDYFVSRSFDWNDRNIGVKVGNQVINWGESAFLALNSLNTVNPPNAALLRIPGFDVKELFQPVGMVFLNADLMENTGLEVFYQYDWKPILVDPAGSFFSVSDTLGAGGSYAMLGYAKAPEDPDGLYRSRDNPNDGLQTFGSKSSRTVYRDFGEERRRRPSDGGQYGVALKMFLDDFNNGTEVGLYFANYHSRIPSVSVMAAQETCIPAPASSPSENVSNIAAACEMTPREDSPGDFEAGREPLPVDTLRLVVEYPENVHLYGVSFNTTVGDWALSGEYAFRDNLPVQVHVGDVVWAGLNPAVPPEDMDLGVGVLPGRRSAFPDFIETNYRGHTIQPGQYIRGYERMKVGQLGTTLLRIIGGDNWIDASQLTFLLEMGMTHVLDFPDLSELQFQGAGVDVSITGGADGTVGTNPRDVRSDPADPHSLRTPVALRQTPTTQDPSGFGDEISYGYRLLTLARYDSLLFGANVEFLNALFHDVKGVAPGLGMNFVEGRKQILSGIRFDYLSRYTGEVRYTWYTGGGLRDSLRDRDNLLVYLGYLF